VALFNSTTDTLKKLKLRERTDRAWFSRLLQHPARKWSRSFNPDTHTGHAHTEWSKKVSPY